MMRVALYIATTLVISALTAQAAFGDAIVITRAMKASTIAEIFITDDSVRVEFEIGVMDVDAFHNIMPDELYKHLGRPPVPFPERIRKFLREDWIIRSDNGEQLDGIIKQIVPRRRIKRDEITGEPLPMTDEEPEPVVFIEIGYPLRGKLKSLTFNPIRNEEKYAIANIGFIVYHRGLPVNDFRHLGGSEKLDLDWDDPWYSKFENRNLRRQFYSPISVFLYVEHYEVRKEIVLRARDLQQWLDLGLEGKDTITVAEQEEIKQKAADFLNDHTPVAIDGEPAVGTLDRVHFIYRTLRTSGVFIPPRDLETVSATLGVIFVYPRDGLPQEVTLGWDLFEGRIQSIPATATDEAGGLPFILTPDDAILKWQNFLKSPTIPGLVDIAEPPQRKIGLTLIALFSSIALVAMIVFYIRRASHGKKPPVWAWAAAGVLVVIISLSFPRGVMEPRLSKEEVPAVVTALLENIYRAFDFRDEGFIYDALERSAAGDVLTDVYLQTRRSLELKNQGGARAKVKEVAMLSAESEPLEGELGFVADCTWNVSGSVLHWGHVHSRMNQLAARLVVKEIGGIWKITDLELLEEKRIDPTRQAPVSRGTSGS